MGLSRTQGDFWDSNFKYNKTGSLQVRTYLPATKDNLATVFDAKKKKSLQLKKCR